MRFVVDSAGKTNDGSLFPERTGVTMKQETEKRKEVMGRIPVYRCGVPCVILGEGWPAWLPVVPALGGRVSVIVCDVTASWDEEKKSRCGAIGSELKGGGGLCEGELGGYAYVRVGLG